jgi:long-chain acyl-CoA synthetase
MISGEFLWNKEITDGLKKCKFGEKKYLAYENMSKNLYEDLKFSALNYPSKVAIIDEDKTYNYKDILHKVELFSNYLWNERGLRKGDKIGVLLYNSIEFAVSFLAMQKLGIVMVPFPTKYRKYEVENLARNMKLNLVITEEAYKGYIENTKMIILEDNNIISDYRLKNYTSEEPSPEEGDFEDTGFLMFTSGTTGISKAAIIKNYNIQHAVNSYCRIFNLNKTTKSVLAIPMYNVTGLVGTFSVMLKITGTLYLYKRFEASVVYNRIVNEKITFYHGSPTVLKNIICAAFGHAPCYSLKLIGCGSSNMPIQDIRLLKKIFPDAEFRTIYGLTETTSPATIFPEDANSSKYIGSSGLVIPGVEIKITDENGNDLSAGHTGEICLRGTNVITQYIPENFGLIDEEGWLKTGDIGYVNDEGYLYVQDRIKDIINRGGEKIYCLEVEKLIYDMSDQRIKEVAVIGINDELYGEVPAAVISTFGNIPINQEKIYEYLKKNLAKYKVPVKLYQVVEVLKSENNKIDKKALKKLFNDKWKNEERSKL